MRGFAVGADAGVEVELAAPEPPRLLDHPVEQRRGVPVAAVVGHRRQVVAVQRLTPGEMVVHAEARRRHRLLATVDEDRNEAIAGGSLYVVHAAHEIVCGADVRPENEHRFGREVRLARSELPDHPPIWDMFFAGLTKPGLLIK